MFGSTGQKIVRAAGALTKRAPLLIAGFSVAVLCFILLNAAMVPVSKSEYCGGQCHEMNIAYRTWELSPHGANRNGLRTECIDCHLPPKDRYFAHIADKAYQGGKDIYKHYFGDEYDMGTMRARVLARMPNQRCLYCHDALLDKPGSSAARIAHTTALAEPEAQENRCVECHPGVGHERQSKLFSP
ncbi:MAG: NapC/NirT family cytochrome c [Sedimentisphaerales bacterium]|nr:NapC/NirT family cytochrome c [Sedimentisphaerales bacterium]